MEKNFITELSTLTAQEDVLHAGREVNELKTSFQDFMLEEERKIQVQELENPELDLQAEKEALKVQKDEFFEIYTEFKTRLKGVVDARNKEEEDNLRRKKFILTKLEEMIKKEENIGAAFSVYNELHEEWKKIGNIPRASRDDVQKEYSKLVESFFYNIKIYRELKEHDLKRNQQLKEAVIIQMEELRNQSSMKELEHSFKNLQNEWEGIGPVQNEQWDTLKAKYWEIVRVLHEKMNQYYDERRQLLNDNIAKKRELIAEVAKVVEAMEANVSAKDWEKMTESLLKIQEQWKSIGFGSRKENEAVWQEFRTICDKFFAKKKEFYGTVQSQYNQVADAKKKLIDEAISLQSSTDWKNTSDRLIRLQKQWKESGHAGQRLEQKLWQDFRSACDVFFAARQKHFSAQDEALEDNLKAKSELIAALQAYEPSEDKMKVLADLKEFSNQFNAIGQVPLKEKDKIFVGYKGAIDKIYSQIKLEGAEKDKILFQARVETLQASPDAENLLKKEKFDIRQQIEKIKSEILQMENNLGFFARSKGADGLRAEVNGKIAAANSKIDSLKAKLRQIPNE
ncbi:MAG: DUF349 domain-containing protein [Bacteroidota bacterium]